MLEQYFTKPSTIDRIRASWIAEEIEAYVAWLEEQCYGVKSILRRVPTVCYGTLKMNIGTSRSTFDVVTERDQRSNDQRRQTGPPKGGLVNSG